MIQIIAAPEALEICSVGILLVEGAPALSGSDPLAQTRIALEESLRAEYAPLSRAERKALHPMDA